MALVLEPTESGHNFRSARTDLVKRTAGVALAATLASSTSTSTIGTSVSMPAWQLMPESPFVHPPSSVAAASYSEQCVQPNPPAGLQSVVEIAASTLPLGMTNYCILYSSICLYSLQHLHIDLYT